MTFMKQKKSKIIYLNIRISSVMVFLCLSNLSYGQDTIPKRGMAPYKYSHEEIDSIKCIYSIYNISSLEYDSSINFSRYNIPDGKWCIYSNENDFICRGEFVNSLLVEGLLFIYDKNGILSKVYRVFKP